jgi:hypothetical protein
MERSNLGRTRLVMALSLAVLGAIGCAAPDAVPGKGNSNHVPPKQDGGNPGWGRGFGDANPQRGYDIAIDKTTSTAVMSFSLEGTVNVDNVGPFTTLGGLDLLVVQISATTGAPIWAKQLGDAFETTRSVVDIDFKGNVIVAGGFDSMIDIGTGLATSAGVRDAFVAKFDASGNPQWLRSFGDPSQQFVTGVATDGEGNVIVVGYAEGGAFPIGDITPAPVTGGDIFIVKLDPAGTPLWAQRIGASTSSDPMEPVATVAVSRADGSIIIAGSHASALAFPELQLPFLGTQDGFVAKLDPFGKGLWGKAFGQTGAYQRVYGVSIGPVGEVLVTGGFQGEVSLGGETLDGRPDDLNLLVAEIDANGNHVWSGGYGTSGDQVGREIMFDSKGNVLVIGAFEGVLEFFGEGALINADVDARWDVLGVKFDGEGAPIWAKAYGDAENQYGLAAVLDADDDAIIAGTNMGTFDLGEGIPAVVTNGVEDAFVLSISP